jgi:hypothetical protein
VGRHFPNDVSLSGDTPGDQRLIITAVYLTQVGASCATFKAG